MTHDARSPFVSPVGVPRPAGGQRGFTVIEVLVVMVIMAILFAFLLPQLRTPQRARDNQIYSQAAALLWRGALSYRIDHAGVLPPVARMAAPGTQLTSPTGQRYIRQWPADPRTGANVTPVATACSGACVPPATGAPFTVVYAVGGGGVMGYMVAYGHNGRPVFQRAVTNGGYATQPDPNSLTVPVG